MGKAKKKSATKKNDEVPSAQAGAAQAVETAAPAAQGALEQPIAPAGRPPGSAPGHVKRKLAKKMKFLDKVAKNQPAKPIGGVRKRKGVSAAAAAGRTLELQSLSASLHDLLQQKAAERKKAPQRFGQSVKGDKGRALVAAREGPRLQQVLQHADFRQNPLNAVVNHLNNTAAAAAAAATAAAGPAKKAGGKAAAREAAEAAGPGPKTAAAAVGEARQAAGRAASASKPSGGKAGAAGARPAGLARPGGVQKQQKKRTKRKG